MIRRLWESLRPCLLGIWHAVRCHEVDTYSSGFLRGTPDLVWCGTCQEIL